MLLGKREPRSVIARRREAFRPAGENLENRLLMAIDLGAATPPTLPVIATHPYGVDLGGAQSSGGAGFSVADVGDVNGDGFDDFVIGAPTVVNSGGQVRLGVGGNSRAYLVFGSSQVNATNVDWFALTAQQRVGDLGQLGNATTAQQNPVNGQPFGTGFNGFDGIQFFNSQTLRSQLGASVTALGDINGDGFADFMIGAPNAPDANGANAGTGRAYLVYGGPNIGAAPNKTVDFDNTLSSGLVKFITFTNSNANSSTGRSVAGVGDVLADGRNDLAIGAPTASLGGVTSGAVYVVDGSAIPTTPTTATINLSTVGQTGGTTGVVFTGARSGDLTGFSVAGAGNVDGSTGAGGVSVQDLLIGAPNANNGTGSAYLIYGSRTLLTTLPNSTSGPLVISLARVGTPPTTTTTPAVVPGAIFNGTAVGDLTGFSVSTAGDFNNDGLADILIGSPGFQGSAGLVSLIYGQSVNATRLTGTIPLATIPSPFTSASFVGATAGALAGYSVSVSGRINSDAINEILIGSPGLNNLDGGVYLVPGNANLNGVFDLATAESQPVAATLLTTSNTPSGTPAFFGGSVSGRLLVPNQKRTIDNDTVADFVVGAPGYGVVPGRGLDGGVFVLEGRTVPLQIPVNTQLQVSIGVDSPTAPFVVNATTPDTVQIFVLSNATTNPTFDPVRDINPKTIVVNGVAFPNATIAADPVDENKDGIPDAIITITPRSSLNLTSATTTFTISGQTLASSPNANQKFTGSASIQVTGGGTTGGGGGSVVPLGFFVPKTFVPPFGPDRYVPQLASLSRLDYQAIPLKVAYHQYLPNYHFQQRTINFFKPPKDVKPFGSKYSDTGRGVSTLGRDVFTRGKFHAGKHFTFTHKSHVIPRGRQTEHY